MKYGINKGKSPYQSVKMFYKFKMKMYIKIGLSVVHGSQNWPLSPNNVNSECLQSDENTHWTSDYMTCILHLIILRETNQERLIRQDM